MSFVVQTDHFLDGSVDSMCSDVLGVGHLARDEVVLCEYLFGRSRILNII